LFAASAARRGMAKTPTTKTPTTFSRRWRRALKRAAGAWTLFSRRFETATAMLGRWERATFKAIGFAMGWMLVYAPAIGCACVGGVYFGATTCGAACLLGAVRAIAKRPTRYAEHATIGLALSLLPATLTATSALSPWSRTDPVVVERATVGGLRVDAKDADAISLVDIRKEHFRFDLMGEYHATLPPPDEKYMYKAGAEASGTYCAVPVTRDGWATRDPVPLWYVCDNNWGGHRNCSVAYDESYDAKTEWYGLKGLSECLRAPVEALDAGQTELHFLHLDFQQSFERKYEMSIGALRRTSVLHELSIDLNAPRVYWNPIQETCCDALAREDYNLLALTTLFTVFPLFYLIYRDVKYAKVNRKKDFRAFYTRAELLSVVKKR